MPPHCRVIESVEVSGCKSTDLPPVTVQTFYLPPPSQSINLSSVVQTVPTPAQIQSLYLPPPPHIVYPFPPVSTVVPWNTSQNDKRLFSSFCFFSYYFLDLSFLWINIRVFQRIGSIIWLYNSWILSSYFFWKFLWIGASTMFLVSSSI